MGIQCKGVIYTIACRGLRKPVWSESVRQQNYEVAELPKPPESKSNRFSLTIIDIRPKM
jgi:hypothetical protein